MRQGAHSSGVAPTASPFGEPVHQAVSTRWLTASATTACAASQPRGRGGSSAAPAISHTANGSQIRSTSALLSPDRSASSDRRQRGERAAATTAPVTPAPPRRRGAAPPRPPGRPRHQAGQVGPHPVARTAGRRDALVVARDHAGGSRPSHQNPPAVNATRHGDRAGDRRTGRADRRRATTTTASASGAISTSPYDR